VNRSLRGSAILSAIGAVLILLSLGAGVLLLPDANRTLVEKQKAAREAQRKLDSQRVDLQTYMDLSERLRQGRQRLEGVEAKLPKGSVGALQWELSRTLHQEAQKAGVRLSTVKFGLPNREGAKGTDLEALEVEFTTLGVYPNLKKFMLAIEKAPLPFAVSSARLEESPEGARLSILLRTFRRASREAS